MPLCRRTRRGKRKVPFILGSKQGLDKTVAKLDCSGMAPPCWIVMLVDFAVLPRWWEEGETRTNATPSRACRHALTQAQMIGWLRAHRSLRTELWGSGSRSMAQTMIPTPPHT